MPSWQIAATLIYLWKIIAKIRWCLSGVHNFRVDEGKISERREISSCPLLVNASACNSSRTFRRTTHLSLPVWACPYGGSGNVILSYFCHYFPTPIRDRWAGCATGPTTRSRRTSSRAHRLGVQLLANIQRKKLCVKSIPTHNSQLLNHPPSPPLIQRIRPRSGDEQHDEADQIEQDLFLLGKGVADVDGQ